MKYVAPEIEVLELEVLDVIQTSSVIPGDDDDVIIPDDGDALPVG